MATIDKSQTVVSVTLDLEDILSMCDDDHATWLTSQLDKDGRLPEWLREEIEEAVEKNFDPATMGTDIEEGVTEVFENNNEDED